MSNDKEITLAALFRYYTKMPHQTAAIAELEMDLMRNGYGIAMRRDRDWFKTWSQAGKQTDPDSGPSNQPDWLPLALDLIKEFEGCRLTAYNDPGSADGLPITIGWGSTRLNGHSVLRGQVITQAVADKALANDVGEFQTTLAATVPGWAQLKPYQKAALVSFSYNVGAHWYNSIGFGTISRAMRDKAYQNVPAALMLYVNPGTSVERGLRRRRIAEGAMFQGRG